MEDAIRDYLARARRFQQVVDGSPRPHRVTKHVLEHDTQQLLCPKGGWVFTRVQTGCIRVQKGDFTAYLLEDEANALCEFIDSTDPSVHP